MCAHKCQVKLTSQNNVSYTLQIVSMLVFSSPVLFFTISMMACIKWHHYECSDHFGWDGSSIVVFLFAHLLCKFVSYVLTCTWITNMKKIGSKNKNGILTSEQKCKHFDRGASFLPLFFSKYLKHFHKTNFFFFTFLPFTWYLPNKISMFTGQKSRGAI